MLTYSLLRNHAGILLEGDYHTLLVLHEVVHDINERSPIVRDREGWFLGLAYDVRKAYEGQRKVIHPSEHFEEIGVRYGVEILWPVLLVQERMLRVSLGFVEHSKRHQAVTYALEAVIEDAIAEDFGAEAPGIQRQWMRLDPSHEWVEEHLGSRGAQFCAWTKSKRKKHLADLLGSLDPMYPHLYELRRANGAPPALSPSELEAWAGREWPDPKW